MHTIPVHDTEATCTLQYGLKINGSGMLYHRSLEKMTINIYILVIIVVKRRW